MANQDITTLIAGLQTTDPKLYQALSALNLRITDIETDLNPLVVQSKITSEVEITLTPPGTFTAAATGTTVRFHWTEVLGAAAYEVRLGTSWDTASFRFRTTSLSADIDPLLVGTYTFLIKSMTSSGAYSTLYSSVVFTVLSIGAPVVSKQVIDNNVLLSWTTPASMFNIDHYILRRDDAQIGISRGNFTTYFEVIAGTYTYSISAVDIAGNEGLQGVVDVTLSIPPDFILESFRTSSLGSFVIDAANFLYLQVPTSFSDPNFQYTIQAGHETEPVHFYFAQFTVSFTLVNVLSEPGPKLLACWTATDWQHHFTNNGWLSPQNQETAGFPIYIQPVNLTGSYEEIFDYGGTFLNLIVTVAYTAVGYGPNPVGIVVKMATSADGISWSAETSGASQFFSSLRFLKFRLEFTAPDTKSFVEISDCTISLNVKKELDSGNITALSTDALGTEVIFNKAFKDVESITLTTNSKEPVYAIYSFVDIPNPVHFFVYAFDSTGNRITYPVSWKARGVV
jgi:hypothetical protein